MTENPDLYRSLGAVEGKLDQIIANQERHIEALIHHVEDDEKHHSEFDRRMRSLESFRSDAAGKYSVFSALAGLCGGAIAAYFAKHF